MITLMLGKEANGYYSAAVSCAALSQFVFAAIVDSMRPSILEAKKTESLNYAPQIARLYSIIVYLALLQSIVLTVAFSSIFLKEHLSRKAFIGLILIVSGTMLLLV